MRFWKIVKIIDRKYLGGACFVGKFYSVPPSLAEQFIEDRAWILLSILRFTARMVNIEMETNLRLNVAVFLSITLFVPYADSGDAYRVTATTDLIKQLVPLLWPVES